MREMKIIGKLGKDPVQSYDPIAGKHYIRFTIASNEFKNNQKVTYWTSASCSIPHLISIISKLKKGTEVVLIGTPGVGVIIKDNKPEAIQNLYIQDIQTSSQIKHKNYDLFEIAAA